MIKNHYKTLEVNRNASIEEIKKAYRKLALKWHPDVNNSPDAHNRFIEINEAYLILSDSEAKYKYDKEYDYCFITQTDRPAYETVERVFVDNEFKQYQDEDLNNWSNNARKQGEKYASMSFEQFSQMVKAIIKETSIQGFVALFYAISGILGANGFFSIIIGLRDSKPEKIFLGILFILLSIVGLSLTSKKYKQ